MNTAEFLSAHAAKVAPRILAAEPVLPTAFDDIFADLIAPECEPDRAVRLIAEAGLAVYGAAVQIDMLPSTDRVAEASRLLAEAYRLIEDAEALASADRNGEPE